jgi:hypothetical protein
VFATHGALSGSAARAGGCGSQVGTGRAVLVASVSELFDAVVLEPQVPKALENFYDDSHLKEAGARLVARLLGEFMLREGVVDRSTTPPSRKAIAAR